MAKKLKPTNLETQYGRLIYEDVDTGKKHSELSVTFPWKGQWVNMPSIHRGKQYNEDQLKSMLNTNSLFLEGGTTSVHPSEMDALKAAEYRSNNMQHSVAKNVMQSFGNLDILNEKTFGMIMDDIKRGKREKSIENAMLQYGQRKPGRAYLKMNPEEKMNDNKDLKNLVLNFGEMPGFKKAENGNYWSADETSDFWKTDAGYEKAQQTWGNNGTLPNYVKKPVRKELDVNAIKNFFNTNR